MKIFGCGLSISDLELSIAGCTTRCYDHDLKISEAHGRRPRYDSALKALTRVNRLVKDVVCQDKCIYVRSV